MARRRVRRREKRRQERQVYEASHGRAPPVPAALRKAGVNYGPRGDFRLKRQGVFSLLRFLCVLYVIVHHDSF